MSFAGHIEAPATLEQFGVDGRQFGGSEFRDRSQGAAGLFQQAQLATLVVAEFPGEFLRLTAQSQRVLLQAQPLQAALVGFAQVGAAMAQDRSTVRPRRQEHLGIAEIEKMALAGTLERIPRQGEVPSPGGDGGYRLVTFEPAEVAHRDAGHRGQALHHIRVGHQAAAET